MKDKEINKCPHCNSTNIAEILYGMPAFSKELDKELKTGKIALGGCMITDEAPLFQCNECKKRWEKRFEVK